MHLFLQPKPAQRPVWTVYLSEKFGFSLEAKLSPCAWEISVHIVRPRIHTCQRWPAWPLPGSCKIHRMPDLADSLPC